MNDTETHLTEQEMDQYAKPIWDYLQLGEHLSKSDVVIVCGAQDLRIPKWGADLVLDNWANLIVMSGGIGRLTPPEWIEGEAGIFAKVAKEADVPSNQILTDNRSTNTRENLICAWETLRKNNPDPTKLIIVNQPFMQRRTKALVEKLISEDLLPKNLQVIFPPSPINYNQYPNEVISKNELISLLVGEVQRLKDYPSKGFITAVEVPEKISDLAEKLLNSGFTQHSI